MTTEIAIMNKSAVALAADSAVTVANDAGSKVFNSANKIFAASKYHPVGAMIHSNAEIMGVPAETVIKGFRACIGKDYADTLSEFVDKFVEFLREDDHVFSDAIRMQAIVSSVYWALASLDLRIRETLFNSVICDLELARESVCQIAEDLVAAFAAEVLARPDLEGVSDSTKVEMSELVHDSFHQEMDYFAERYSISDSIMDSFIQAVREMPWRQVHVDRHTGCVFAGFGRKDVFPAFRSFNFSFAWRDAIWWSHFQQDQVDMGNTALIVPFAQQEMAESFMEGRTRKYEAHWKNCLRHAFHSVESEYNEDSTDQGKAALAALQAVWEKIRSKVWDETSAFVGDEYVRPVLSTVAVMPIQELATLAESLVSLAVARHRATPGEDSVGPPVDVATISKGDGFVWIRRKHYFEQALNPTFASSYFERDRMWLEGAED